MKKPLVSIVVTTFNHSAFIEECLTSALNQKTDFEFEIVVGEDASTDDTRSKIEKLRLLFPELIRPIYHDRNTGGHPNFLACLDTARGEWIAWLEGDDFWTDPLKLSKQLRILRSNPSLALCFSNGRSFLNGTPVADGELLVDRKFYSEKVYDKKSLLYGNFFPTCTLVFRKAAIWPLPVWYSTLPLGDWTLSLLALESGSAYFLDQELAAYRRHPGGQWSHQLPKKNADKMIEVSNCLLREFPTLGDRVRLNSVKTIWLVRRAKLLVAEGRLEMATRDYLCALKSFICSNWWDFSRWQFLIKKICAKFV